MLLLVLFNGVACIFVDIFFLISGSVFLFSLISKLNNLLKSDSIFAKSNTSFLKLLIFSILLSLDLFSNILLSLTILWLGIVSRTTLCIGGLSNILLSVTTFSS